MKFKFPLQKVLDHRKTKEDLAQKDFQEELNRLNDLEHKLNSMLESLHEAHLRSGKIQTQGGAQGPSLIQINEFIRGQTVLIQKQREKIVNQQIIVEDKREILRQAAVETKIINKFKEKKFNEFREAQDKEEQKEMDEQSILRFGRKPSQVG